MKLLLRQSVNALPLGLRTKVRRIPGLSAFQRWLVARTISGEPFVHTINAGPAAGLVFEITLPLDKPVWAGTYEQEFAAAINNAVKPGCVCYDIGGYRGYMSGAMALAGASQVYAFEPLPANQQALRRLCELNPRLPITVMSMALGSNEGKMRLKVMADPSMGKLVSSSFQLESVAVDEIDVSVRRIDDLVDTNMIAPPDVMKIDVEGAELQVIEGAEKVLGRHLPLIFLEAHSDALEMKCKEMLTRLGYSVRRLDRHPKRDEEARHLVCEPRCMASTQRS